MNMGTSENIVIILLCSSLGYDPNDKSIKPFTVTQFNALEKKLMSSFVPIGDILTKGVDEISKKVKLTEEEINRIKSLMLRADRISDDINKLAENKIYITTIKSTTYPKRIKEVLCKKAPLLFFYCGDINILNNKCVSIIGSRTAANDEISYAKKHARMSAQNNITVVSGGAKGIDTIAKEQALKSGGKVVTYVSDNMLKYIKENAEHILYDKLLVLSSFHPAMPFIGYNALERNKYIYASSEYAVVVSSGDETGGSYKGAVTCLKDNLTKLYVKDDDFTTKGNKKLIELGGLPLNENHERLV